MGAPVLERKIGDIHDEGEIVILVQSWEEPSVDVVDATELSSSSLYHYSRCFGEFSVRDITDTKKVLFCERCGLRLSIPSNLKTIKDLREHLGTL